MKTKHSVLEEFRCRAIREAAVRAVARKGITAVTVQDIADEASVAKGTVYLYFKSRDEILESARATMVDELLGRLRDAATGAAALRSAIESVVGTHLRFFDERPELFRLFLTTAEPLAERRLRKVAAYRTHLAQWRSVLEAAGSSVRPVDTERAAIAIAAVTRDVMLSRMTEKDPPPVEQDIAFVRDFVCRGLAE